MTSRKIIAFNWKLNPESLPKARQLLGATQRASDYTPLAEVVVFPPFEYLFPLLNRKSRFINLSFGAQDCFWENNGPYTGEISPEFLKRQGVGNVIIGHSERRRFLFETDSMVMAKTQAALKSGLRVFLCLGEDKGTQAKGERAVRNFIKTQLLKALGHVTMKQFSNLVLVYEPVWAISSQSHGKTDDPVHAAQIISYLKEILAREFKLKSVRVLYGGSVDAQTIKSFLNFDDIDGFLIGAASLKPVQVSGIIRTVENSF